MHQLNQEENNPLMEIARLQKQEKVLFRLFILAEIIVVAGFLVSTALKLHEQLWVIPIVLTILALGFMILHVVLKEMNNRKQQSLLQEIQISLANQLHIVNANPPEQGDPRD